MIFNPLDEFYKYPLGAVEEGTLITFRLRCFRNEAVAVIYDENGFIKRINMQKEGEIFSCSFALGRGLYWYYFDLNDGSYVGINGDYFGEITDKPKSFQLSVFDLGFKTPSWLNGGIIYQIFPDRFNKSSREKTVEKGKILHENWNELPNIKSDNGEVLNNDFFGGDLQGIIEKLDYLKELNVSAIYLNPIFKAFSNHRYDTGDYLIIDPLLGDENDLKNLVTEGEKRGIKIILDGVFNHTGSDSVYFNKNKNYKTLGAYESKESKYYNWFNFIDYPDEYESWWGIKTLPQTNKTDSGFVDFITGKDGVIEKYAKLGIGGFRLDVVDELPEKFSEKIRTALKNINKDAILIGEVWEDASNKISYGKRRAYFLGKELDSVMNYPLKNALINYVLSGDEKELLLVLKTQIDHYPKQCLDNLMNILSTHDTARILSVLSGKEVFGKSKEELSKISLSETELIKAEERLKTAVLIQYTVYGVPCIYYGDEAGVEGYIDPLNRKTFPWEKERKSILSFYKKMGEIRNISAFKNGKTELLTCEKGALIYKRTEKDSEVLIAVNLGKDIFEFSFNGKLKDLLSGKIFENTLKLNVNDKFVLVNAN